MKIFEKKIETDFEFFVRSLPALEPIEFLGLAKVLCIPTVRESKVLELSKDVNGSYTWESGLWPWEVKKDV